MSWLDLPPLDGPSESLVGQVKPQGGDGLVRVLLTLVGGGLIGLVTEYGLDLWKPVRPGDLAGVLGVGEAERTDAGDGYAECGFVDPRRGILTVRNRSPYSGVPRRFDLTQGSFPDEKLDPHSAWQLKQMVVTAVRRDERWALQPAGFGMSDLSIAVETGVARTIGAARQPQIIVTATPARVGSRWQDGRLGVPGMPHRDVSRTATVPVSPQGMDAAVKLVTTAISTAGMRSWELMPVFPTL